MEKAQSQNKMESMQEGKLLLTMGVPLMISMLVAALYNIVDTYFVSQITGSGDAAANALSLAFPVQTLMTALNVGTGVGVGAALSRAIGSETVFSAEPAGIARLYDTLTGIQMGCIPAPAGWLMEIDGIE